MASVFIRLRYKPWSLAARCETTRTLTVYDSVHYGFYLYAVPEPATWAPMVLAFAAVAIVRARRKL